MTTHAATRSPSTHSLNRAHRTDTAARITPKSARGCASNVLTTAKSARGGVSWVAALGTSRMPGGQPKSPP